MSGEDIIILGYDLARHDEDRSVITFVGRDMIVSFEGGWPLPDIRDHGEFVVDNHRDLGLAYFFSGEPSKREIADIDDAPRPWDAPRQDWLKGRKRRLRR